MNSKTQLPWEVQVSDHSGSPRNPDIRLLYNTSLASFVSADEFKESRWQGLCQDINLRSRNYGWGQDRNLRHRIPGFDHLRQLDFKEFAPGQRNRLVYSGRGINKNIGTFVLQANHKEADETTSHPFINNEPVITATGTDPKRLCSIFSLSMSAKWVCYKGSQDDDDTTSSLSMSAKWVCYKGSQDDDDTISSLSMSIPYKVSLLQRHNPHSEPAIKWQPISILYDSFDGKSMGDTGPRHSETLRSGCQQVLKEGW